MKKNRLALIGSLLLLVLLTACTTEGFEGDGVIRGNVAHHSAAIGEASIYVAFGKKELPGTLVSDFDASVVADTAGNYEILELKKGDYYLYAVGYDSAISQVVRGGLAVTIGKGEEATANIPVTE